LKANSPALAPPDSLSSDFVPTTSISAEEVTKAMKYLAAFKFAGDDVMSYFINKGLSVLGQLLTYFLTS
jgi:hypothetical protein